MESDVLREFDEFGIVLNKNLASKCSTLCQRYNINAEAFVEHWLAFSTSRLKNENPTETGLDLLEKDVLNKTSSLPAKKNSQADTSIVSNSSFHDIEAHEDHLLDSYVSTPKRVGGGVKRFKTPDVGGSRRPFESPGLPFSPALSVSAQNTPSSSAREKYENRTNALEVVMKHKTQDRNVTWVNDNANLSVCLKYDAGDTSKPWKYMLEKLRDRAAILDEATERWRTVYEDEAKVSPDEWFPVTYSSTEPVRVLGRVCCDSNGRMNAASILLEGAREDSNGTAVALDVRHLAGYAFFPGQIVALEGINPEGKCFQVTQCLPVPSLESCSLSLQIPDGEKLQIVAASGPYTFSDELSYAPLTDFLSYVVQHQPHVCVLMGPFVDIKNKIIETGDLDVTYHELFMQLMDKITSTLQGLKTQVVLVASARDAHHDVIYPTPPYLFIQSLGPNFHVVPDPCVVDIAGLKVAVTATDILFHLGKEEVAAAPPGSDRLGRLASHLLKQRTFYPLFPSNEEVSLDLHFWEQRALLQEKPHVIILPSDLRMFIKEVEDCVMVNPERLCKGSSGGSFLRFQVDSSEGIQGEILRI